MTLDGWWIDDVAVGATAISNGEDLDAWDSPSEVNATEVAGFTVQLVAYDDAHDTAHWFELPLNESFDGSISGAELDDAIGVSAETVAQYAPYALTVDGTRQPGGGS